jgi:predicted phosphohydrolase
MKPAKSKRTIAPERWRRMLDTRGERPRPKGVSGVFSGCYLLAMRLVAVADTHLFHDELVVPEGDVFIHAGDACRGGTMEELALAVQWIRALPHRHKLFVAGNHDWAFLRHPVHARRLMGSSITYLEDSEITLDGVRFWGSPWQPTFHDWAFNLPRGEPLAAKWALIPEGIDVLITHGPPQGVGDRSSMAGRQGCLDLRRRAEEVKPPLHFFGHIHEDGGAWSREGTTYVNCTTWECERRPTVIDVEPGGQVTLVDVPPRKS